VSTLTRRELLKGAALLGAAGALPEAGAQTSAADNASSAASPSLPAPAAGEDGGVRQRRPLSEGWRFCFGHAQDTSRDFGFGAFQRTYAKAGVHTAESAMLKFDDSDWQPVQLPHDWAVGLPFVTDAARPLDEAASDAGKDVEDLRAAHGYKPVGRDYPETSIGWYRRGFRVEPTTKSQRVCIEFDGVFRNCTVFVNGYIVRHHASGYTSFSVDVTDFLETDGNNQLAVRVDASLGEGWFYEGAGIYRQVWLVVSDSAHVAHWGNVVRSKPVGGGASIDISTDLINEGASDRHLQLAHWIYAPDGSLVGQAAVSAGTLTPEFKHTATAHVDLGSAALWSPASPQLYRLLTQVIEDGVVIDDNVVHFGIRSVTFDPKHGLLLNGERLQIQGVCNHQDHAGVGTAIPDALQEYRIVRSKELGANAWRSAHNPPSPVFLDLCDRLGMLVIDETRRMSSDSESLDELSSMIRRDRNHPSVILWSLGNEEPQQSTARGARIIRSMKHLQRELDPTRLCTAAMDQGFGEGITAELDVLGFNYRAPKIAPFHDKHPDLPVLGSETGSTVCTRGIYKRDDALGFVPAYDTEAPWWASTAHDWVEIFGEHPFIAGGFVWTGFDYRGEPTPFNRWPNVASQFGIMDSCGFAKDNYYYYQANWTDQPVLHLLPHWDWPGREGEKIAVWCHTNLDEAELFLNGRSLGKRRLKKYGHLEWSVLYAPGKLEVRGYRNGKHLLTDIRVTPGAPAAVRISTEKTQLSADGQDCLVLKAELIDADSNPLPRADQQIHFNVKGGRVIGVGNGDPTSHEADQSDDRHCFSGLCMAVIQAGTQAGELQIEATSAGLKGATLTLPMRAAS